MWVQCHEVISELRLHVARQDELLVVLQERPKLDSRNSSNPPSSDGPSSGNREQRRASQRKRGARTQQGHKGSHRALWDESQVDNVFGCKPVEVCDCDCDCGAAVHVLVVEPVRHPVFDVPPVKAQVNEYRRYSGRCLGCGKAHRAAFPAGVPTGQIGPPALALIGTLDTHYHLPQFKIRDLLARLMGVDFSVGVISQAHGKVIVVNHAGTESTDAGGSSPRGRQAPVKQLDETRCPREGAGSVGRGDARGRPLQPAAFACALRGHRPHWRQTQRHRGLGPLCRL